MHLSPMTSVSKASYTNSKNTSFKALKFELDRPTKEYYLRLEQEDGTSAQDTLKFAEIIDNFMDSLTQKANLMAQERIDNSPLKGKTLKEVWPEDKVVKVVVKPFRHNDDLILKAYFNNSEFAQEVEDALYQPNGPKRSNIKSVDVFSFINDFTEHRNYELKQFVQTTMKHYTKFIEMTQRRITPVDEKEQNARVLLKKWLNK